jgi:ubiquinone/menaquinone biosynthesis C-methylase UbiE
MIHKEKIKQAYDGLADLYFETRIKGGSSQFFNEMLEMPRTLRMLGNVKSKKILDLGCGPGRYAHILTDKNAKIVGIDNSINSLKIAEKEAPEAKFVLGDIEKLPFKSAEFNIVFSSLVLGHFEKWDKIFSEVRRVLKRNGIFIFSIHNPIRETLEKEKWFFRTFREIKNYFKERILQDNWAKGGRSFPIFHHHKTYGTIIRYIASNGFELIDYEDCKPLPKAKKKYPKLYNQAINTPYFCVWKLRKK